MNYLPSFLLAVTALYCLPALGDDSLFNGKDLSNWETRGKAIWKVDDGEILGGQDGDPKRSGLLISKESYRDFELSFEFKIDEHGKYNSGVYFRFHADRKGPRLQLNLGRGAAGEPVGLYLDDWLDKGDENDEYRLPEEWNRIKLRVTGAKIEAWLNEQKIVEFEDADRLKHYLEPGRIAFQTYGAEDHSGWVKFRNIKMARL
ncbi:MAG: DUF1080 domain-containing protein [Verrucomicrobiales bacterium]|nr:DUF1080 domain-containing protein [Verrucomicrobiales bacterium]